MVSITVSVPEEIRKVMKEFPEINWSGLVRKTIEEKAEALMLKNEMLKELKEEKEISDWAVKLVRKGRR